MIKKTLLFLCCLSSFAYGSDIVVSPKYDRLIAHVNVEKNLIIFKSPASQVNIDLTLPFEHRAKLIDFFEHHKIFGEVDVNSDKSIHYQGFFGNFTVKNLEQFQDRIESEKKNTKKKFIKLDNYYFAMADHNTLQSLYDKKMYDHTSLIMLADKLKLRTNSIMLVYPYKNDFVFYAIN